MAEVARRVIAITGGARGIGAAIAQALAARGARVALGDVDEAAVRATAAAIGRGAIGHSLDVTSTASFTAFLDHVERDAGPRRRARQQRRRDVGRALRRRGRGDRDAPVRRELPRRRARHAPGAAADARPRQRSRGEHRVGREPCRARGRGDIRGKQARGARLQHRRARGAARERRRAERRDARRGRDRARRRNEPRRDQGARPERRRGRRGARDRAPALRGLRSRARGCADAAARGAAPARPRPALRPARARPGGGDGCGRAPGVRGADAGREYPGWESNPHVPKDNGF